jgi:hypothetical protein
MEPAPRTIADVVRMILLDYMRELNRTLGKIIPEDQFHVTLIMRGYDKHTSHIVSTIGNTLDDVRTDTDRAFAELRTIIDGEASRN